VTRSVSIEVRQVGHGPDPWGGYRRGFEGTTTLRLSNFGIDYDLGPAAREVELFLSIEGVRQ
jgi:polyisoprenoid-binding protein YceI